MRTVRRDTGCDVCPEFRRGGTKFPAASVVCHAQTRCSWRRSRRRCQTLARAPVPSQESATSVLQSAARECSAGSGCLAKRKRIAFVDFWPGFDENTDRWFTRDWFEQNLVDADVVGIDDDPDVIVFSVFGTQHRRLIQTRASTTKFVFFTGENVRPPVGKVHLCISFDVLPDAPMATHARLPLWIFNREVHDVIRMHEARLRGEFDLSVAKRSGFCSWVASNSNMYNAKVRLSFVQALSTSYLPVACGGEALNNVGGPVSDKQAFLKEYRFNVAFENASHPGYCTEKLLHAFAAGCVPIYWGDPRISLTGGQTADFNLAALISAHDFESPAALIEHIGRVDKDPRLLEAYLRQPILSEEWYQRLRDWRVFCTGFTDLLFSGTAS